jgi:2-iminoacetate synthase
MFSEFLKDYNYSDISKLIENIKFSESSLDRVLNKALNLEKLNFDELLILLNKECLKYTNLLLDYSRRVSLKRHGNVLRFYAPMYVSNECVNSCIYCGFNVNNKIKRLTLTACDALKEIEKIKNIGIDNLLIVSGECKTSVSKDYLIEVVKNIRDFFSTISIEVAPMETSEYKELYNEGVDGVVSYQETYNPSLYPIYHPKGPKSEMTYRLDTMDRAGKAGMRSLGVGSLLGLSNPLVDSFYTLLHARFLEKKYWKSLVSISFPRIRPSESGFKPKYDITDDMLLHLIAVSRLFLPDAELILSTRESKSFRNKAFKSGVTRISAGSKTSPLGYSKEDNFGKQFSISDDRSPMELYKHLLNIGFDPVFKDWDKGFRKENE